MSITSDMVNAAIRDENNHTCEFPASLERFNGALERLQGLFDKYGAEAFANGAEHGAGYSFDDSNAERVRAEFEEVLRSL